MAIKIIFIVFAIVFLFCFMWINRYQITPVPGTDGGVYRHDRWTGNIDYIFESDILLSRGQKSSVDYFGPLEKEEPQKTVEEILGPKPMIDEKQRPNARELFKDNQDKKRR